DAEGTVVAAAARIRIRPGDPIEVAREYQGRRRVAERRARAFGQRPPATLLAGPYRGEQPVAMLQQRLNRRVVFLTLLQVALDGNLSPDPGSLREDRDAERHEPEANQH